jgi:F-type H+-transporting ATPase subunit epsilon
MLLEVVSPDATLFSGEVNSVAVPGTNGAFQMLDNHAPIVSLLGPGKVKIGGKLSLPKDTAHHFTQQGDDTFLELPNGGTVEMQHNKIILLAD